MDSKSPWCFTLNLASFTSQGKELEITCISSLFSEVTATLHSIANSSCEHIPHLQVKVATIMGPQKNEAV